jgi:crotonobetainyl-CoA:carnitine CoA-transferase CaiB-like acyl-CoA transferase
MYAFSGILLALYQRERTDLGTSFEISLLEALGEWMAQPAYFAAYGGSPPPRAGASHASIAPYGPFVSQDEKTVFLGVQNEREWRAFCELVLEDPTRADDVRFRTNVGRVANREALHTAIQEVFSRLTSEQIEARLEQAQVATARLRSPYEFWEHPQLQARDRWRNVDSPVGSLRALLPPITLRGAEPRMDAIPAVGAHNVAILKTLGFSDDEIDQLRADGVI